MKITKAIKNARIKWIQALESGRFRQTEGQLREVKSTKSYGYCCLGVLCKVNPDLGKFTDTLFIVKGGDDYDGSYEAEPPTDVLNRVGMSRKTKDKCIAMNDDENKSFKDIASYLRGIWRITK